jgi:hypothetical protein
VLLVSLVLVLVKFLSQQHIPVLLKRPSFFLLFNNSSFEMNRANTIALVASLLVTSQRHTTHS